MRILYICHRFPFPPARGGKIRPFNTIKHLGRSHEVTVASIARSSAEVQQGQGLAAFCHRYEVALVKPPIQALRMLSRLPTLTPSSMGFFYSSRIARKIEELLRGARYDLIFVHCSSVAQYVSGLEGIPKILDFGDMDSQKWLDYARFKPFPLSLGYRLEGMKLRREEKRLARCFDLCTATTRAEWATLNGYRSPADTDWFPNGVDAEYFSPSEAPYDANTISFVGRMDYYPNQECMFDFCANVLPLLQQRRSQLNLKIIGADPAPSVRRLGAIPGVTVTGSVPDVRPHVRQSALMVAPLNIARGTQNKILEAMAMGVPVVTSPLAAAGVDAVSGEHLLVARTPAEYAQAILQLLDGPMDRKRLAGAGRQRILTHHRWETSMRKLDTIIERCLAKDTRSRRISSLSGKTPVVEEGPVDLMAPNGSPNQTVWYGRTREERP